MSTTAEESQSNEIPVIGIPAVHNIRDNDRRLLHGRGLDHFDGKGERPWHSRDPIRKPHNPTVSSSNCTSAFHEYPHALKRPYDDPQAMASSKRRRIEHLPERSRYIVTPRNPGQGAQPKRMEILVNLPSDCLKGAPGSQKRRRQWIDVQKQKIQQGRGVKIDAYAILDRVVRFTCLEHDSHPTQGSVATGEGTKDIEVEDDPSSDTHSEIVIRDYLKTRASSSPSPPLDGYPNTNLAMSRHADRSYPGTDVVLDDHSIHPGTLSGTSAPNFVRTTRRTLHRQSAVTVSTLQPRCIFRSGTLWITPATSLVSSSTEVARELPVLPWLDEATGNGLGIPLASTTDLEPPAQMLPRDHIDMDRLSPVSVNDEPYSPEPSPFSSLELEMDGDIIRLPNQTYDKPRRILLCPSSASLFNISMHGFINRTDNSSLRHWHALRTPIPTGEAIDDACLLTAADATFVLLAHARDDQQLSLIRVGHGKMETTIPLDRPWNNLKKGGVSAVTDMIQPLMFASGGHDRIVHLWDVRPDFTSATPRPLTIKHTSLVQSLLPIRDTSHKLLSAGADCNVHIWDLASERVVNTMKPSNSVYHAHRTSSPFCTLLEVAHRELQFEIRDHRLVPEKPVQRFGYTTSQVHGRFMKGALLFDYFACGDREGSVRLWDLRNVKKQPATIMSFQGHKVTQVSFTQSRIIACSEDNQISLMKYLHREE